MFTRRRLAAIVHSKLMQNIMFMLGLLLMILAPLAGIIPGPGGIFVFAAGLALALKNSDWAKRRYVRFKKWQPKAGRWADWSLRRPSAKRRAIIRKERKAIGCPPPADEVAEGPLLSKVPNPPATDPPDADGDGKESATN